MSHSAEGEIFAVEKLRQDALIAGDIDALDAIFDDSLIHIHAPGLVHTKAQLLEHVAVRRAYIEITRQDLRVRVFGDTAVITGGIVNRMHAPGGGERIVDGVVTQVVHRSPDEQGADGHWRFVSFQMTPYGEEVWGKLPSEKEKA
ncbi:nuclear transport factor 2 family protein [Microbacterium sp. A204]|uniref:nuclear transport factor 2 family protein n=1 Tax=Microbacterium sp. A204 TaxID=3457321 RepID=UPI003FD1E2A8